MTKAYPFRKDSYHQPYRRENGYRKDSETSESLVGAISKPTTLNQKAKFD
ncbi:MAG: hypothetical protein HQM10_27275 [Candidatus Riflebacteria bacterium]|nr:hypothetical protein [Candidatus Riflebacteria bacterium]